MSDNLTKKFYQKGWFWIVIAVIGVIFISAKPNNQAQQTGTVNNNMATTTTTEQQAFKIGDQIQLGDYILTVNSANDCTSSNQFIRPNNGNKFIAVDITQENNGTDAKSYNALNFKLQDDKAFTYSYNFMSCKDPAFGSGSLQGGQKTRGYLTFQIPTDSQPAQLLFTPGFFSSDQITINLQ